jgi:DNA-binding GntR family transcriptional regulator
MSAIGKTYRLHGGANCAPEVHASAVQVPERTANARAYLRLKQAVLSGRFGPGEVVTLRAVTQLLGGGEMAAREAVKRLISEGAFTALPNRSARVPELGRRDIVQLSELRVMLESHAAGLATANITVPQIAGLRALEDRMIACVASGDFDAYKPLNMAFHFEIYRIADDPPLASLIDSLWLRMAPYTSRTVDWVSTIPGRFQEIATCRHEELLSAFQRRDIDGARKAMTTDLAEIHETDGFWSAVQSWIVDP